MNVSAILTYVVTSVFALEAAIPAKGFGTTKKQIVMSGVQTILKATTTETAMLAASGSNPGTNTTISAISAAAEAFIDATVAAMNKAGSAPK